MGLRDGTRHWAAEVDRDVADMWPREEDRTLGPPGDLHPEGSYAVWKLVFGEAPLMPTTLQHHPGSPFLRSWGTPRPEPKSGPVGKGQLEPGPAWAWGWG